MEELIIRVLQGSAPGAEQRRLRLWLEEAPENQHRYHQIVRLWNVTAAAEAPVDPGEIPDTEALIAQAEGKAVEAAREPSQQEPARQARSRVPRRTWILQVAAAAALLIPLGLGLESLVTGGNAEPGVILLSEVATGDGEMTTVTLADGSAIRVGPLSTLRITEEEGNQIAWMQGRAFFGVRGDGERTFTVRTPHGEAVVIGTRFEVRSSEKSFRVLVLEGSVTVSAANVETKLEEGDVGQSRSGRPPSTSRVENAYAHLDWMENSLLFQATPLWKVMQEVERRLGVEMVLESPELAEVTVTATFTGQGPEEVVGVLCEVVGAECRTEDGRFIFFLESQTLDRERPYAG